MLRLIFSALGLVAAAAITAPVALGQTPPTLRPGILPPADPLPDEPELPDEIIPLENPFAFDGPMTPDRLGELVLRVDESAETAGNGYIFTVAERQLRVVYDEDANRMRIITPIVSADNLPDGLAERMLQANFDAVLDARYAIGSGMVWATFIHPLASLTDEDFLSGIAQTAVAAETFGTSFTSGAVVFGGGDTTELNAQLLERLREAVEDDEDDRGI